VGLLSAAAKALSIGAKANETLHPFVTRTIGRESILVNTNTRTSCHITNEYLSIQYQIWWYNATKDLDKAHGQVMPPRSKIYDFFSGHRTINDPNFKNKTNAKLGDLRTSTAIVDANGYIIDHEKAFPVKPITGTIMVGPSGGATSLGFLIEEGSQLETIWNDKKLFESWTKATQSLSRAVSPLNEVEAQQLLDNAKKLGIIKFDFNPKGLEGLEQTGQWKDIPHFKIGSIHIPIQKGVGLKLIQ